MPSDASESSDTNQPNPDIDYTVLNESINIDDVSYALKNLKNNKSHGTDLILNEFLKCAEDKMINIFVYLFNIILETGLFPEDWTKGLLRPIYKNKGMTRKTTEVFRFFHVFLNHLQVF